MKSSRYFSKQDTMTLKGLAMLMMLWWHLFYQQSVVDGLQDVVLAGHSVSKVLWHATYPVYIFIILSGYGLYLSYIKGSKGNVARVAKLYGLYWFILLIFGTIGYFMKGPDIYPGTLKDVFLNFIGIDTSSYYPSAWFILPWAIIILLSGRIFRWLDKIDNPLTVVILSTAVYAFTLLVSRYLLSNCYGALLYAIGTLILPFTLGYLCVKYLNISVLRMIFLGGGVLAILLLLNICWFDTKLQPFFAMAIVLTFVSFKRRKFVDKILLAVGKHSTSMWLIHTWIYYILFSEFIYSFKIPLLIFAVLSIITYLLAVVVDLLYDKILMKL